MPQMPAALAATARKTPPLLVLRYDPNHPLTPNPKGKKRSTKSNFYPQFLHWTHPHQNNPKIRIDITNWKAQ
uniref:Uncharacterized protein MANES_09G131000 n=1 Tax=Rhizophora mucronata TaxID=61149 RepID=A0A2P2JKE1_RHIMU